MTAILGVHGIWNYKYFRQTGTQEQAAALMADEWSAALEHRLDIAYYAHHLHRGTPQGPVEDPATLDPDAQDLLIQLAEMMREGVSIPQGPRTVRVRQAAGWITRKFGPAARLFAIVFCREVHTYLSSPDSPRRAGARKAVAEAIARTRPDVVIAHSLGSIVTYEALCAYPDHEIPLLITLGSPLAMPGIVAPRLIPGTGETPPKVRRWVNLADVGDLVALPRTGLKPRFTGVEKDVEVIVGEWDFHTVLNYLRTPEVRDEVKAAGLGR